MAKIITIPTNDNLPILCSYSDAVLLGIKDMSTNLPNSYTVDEIKGIIDTYKDLEFFVALNKNMHSKDLDILKNMLIEIDKLNIAGVFYYDIAVLGYHKELELKTPLVWSQEHLTTNYATMNYWREEGVTYTYVSSEITLDEILDIKKKTDMNLIVPIFGYLPMFVSKRNLVKNYLEYFDLNKESKVYSLHKENKYYPIDNTELGTVVYSSHILNGLREFKLLEEAGVSYVTLNSYRIDDLKFREVLKLYRDRKYEMDDVIENMFPNIDKGFLYKETIYRVKKNEKK